MIECPYCSHPIQDEARLCRFCGGRMGPESIPGPPEGFDQRWSKVKSQGVLVVIVTTVGVLFLYLVLILLTR